MSISTTPIYSRSCNEIITLADSTRSSLITLFGQCLITIYRLQHLVTLIYIKRLSYSDNSIVPRAESNQGGVYRGILERTISGGHWVPSQRMLGQILDPDKSGQATNSVELLYA